MLTSLALIFLVGLSLAGIFQLLKLPRIIGMLLTGIILGPYALNLLDDSILLISSDLRQMALIIILLKAGLSLNLADLKKVGRPAIMMSFVPASFEILAFILFAPAILNITRIEAAVMGAVLGAVSPAVVIPRMVQLMDSKYGTNKSIPQLILAGASCDDIFVIVLFTESRYKPFCPRMYRENNRCIQLFKCVQYLLDLFDRVRILRTMDRCQIPGLYRFNLPIQTF